METSASLLDRLRSHPDEASWRRLDDLYRPLIRRWLLRDPSLGQEVEDLIQEVMSVLIQEIPGFQRQRLGSFRRWLRAITVHRLQAFWRGRRNRPQPAGPTANGSFLDQLADPTSELSRQWDREHDQHVFRRLLDLTEPDFEPNTWRAFRLVVFEGVKPTEAAAELAISVNAVLLAKSRILNRLREEARELID